MSVILAIEPTMKCRHTGYDGTLGGPSRFEMGIQTKLEDDYIFKCHLTTLSNSSMTPMKMDGWMIRRDAPMMTVWEKTIECVAPSVSPYEDPKLYLPYLQQFINTCRIELGLDGFFVMGTYEYDGRLWDVQAGLPVVSVNLPNDFNMDTPGPL